MREREKIREQELTPIDNNNLHYNDFTPLKLLSTIN